LCENGPKMTRTPARDSPPRPQPRAPVPLRHARAHARQIARLSRVERWARCCGAARFGRKPGPKRVPPQQRGRREPSQEPGSFLHGAVCAVIAGRRAATSRAVEPRFAESLCSHLGSLAAVALVSPCQRTLALDNTAPLRWPTAAAPRMLSRAPETELPAPAAQRHGLGLPPLAFRCTPRRHGVRSGFCLRRGFESC